jgi:HlyD family secretion protein
MKKILVLLVLLVAAAGIGWGYWRQAGDSGMWFRTANVHRGDLQITISATGTVEPEELVDVGAQVAGKIQAFGKDPHANGKPIDYGSTVEEGTVLAQIDDSLYASDVEQAAAQLEQTKANVRRAEADLAQMKAKLHQAEQNWKRAQELGVSRALSATDYDSYKAAYETAIATVGVGEATIDQAQKTVLQAEAALKRARENLGYCTIRSPVKGVIVDRRVNIGQTVVASLNAPSLFLIAKDLKKMQVWASVNEADIGSIHPGQGVSFTVDAYPGETFRGQVGKIRLNASMTQNVVTYTVEVNTDNSDGKLLPYLTANLQFEVARRENVLLVPNAALRWTPSADHIAPDARPAYQNREQSLSPSTRIAGAGGMAGRAATHGTVWILDGSYVRPMEVRVGLTDGVMTEIESDTALEGKEVVVGVSEEGPTDDATSPFTPRILRRRRSA